MNLITPEIGLVFWMTLTFLTVLFLLSKFAWKPIMNAIKEREQSIENALSSAENAKKEMAKLQSNNEQLLRDAQLERDALLKSAREAKEMIVSEARTKATEEAERIISIAREAIKNEKLAAITELKNQVAILSLEIAEKLVKQNLSSDEKQKELSNKLIADLKLN
jgi:F-type H+-transporting ATPase subunit b